MITRRLFAGAAIATALLTGFAAQARGPANCETYTNKAGHAVCRPVQTNHKPAGATAKCRDGAYSFSENHRGTCSHHGGVGEWYR
jgi:hypothetical protein